MKYHDPTEVIIAIKRLLEFVEECRLLGENRPAFELERLSDSAKRLIEKVLGGLPL